MTLKQLEAFYWAATCLNFSVAAERVHLSVSSLSKRIAELEESLGTQLFDRSGRSAVLTAQGVQLLPGVRTLLAGAAQLQESVGHVHGLQGRCRIGCGELSALTWMPQLVKLVSQVHPALQLELHAGIGEVLEQRTENGELDLVVIGGPSSKASLTSELVAEVDFVWVATQSLLDRAQTDDPRELLATQTLIVLPNGSGAIRVLDQWLPLHGLQAQSRLTCSSWGAIVGMVAEGLGFAYMPKRWAQALQARDKGLRILGKGGALAPLPYTVQWRRDDVRPLITGMREQIKRVIDFPAPRCFG